MNLRTSSLFAVTFLLSASSIFAAPFEITDVDGKIVIGRLDMLNDAVLITGSLALPLENVVQIRNDAKNPFRTENLSDPPAGKNSIASILKKQDKTQVGVSKFPDSVAVIDLVDGSRLIATAFNAKGKEASCRLLSGNDLSIPLEKIVAVRLDAKNVTEAKTPPDDWQRISTMEKNSDRIIVGLPGTLDFYDGVLAEVGRDAVSFVIDGETLPVPRRKVFGLLFRAEKQVPTSKSYGGGVLTFFDGSRLQLENVTADNAGTFFWTTRSGITGTVAFEMVEAIDFSRKNAVSLAELKPIRVDQSLLFSDNHTPGSEKSAFSKTVHAFRANKMLGKNPDAPAISGFRLPQNTREKNLPEKPLPGLDGIKSDNHISETGLLIPARTVLEYALDEPFSKLRGTVGFDDRVRPGAAARLLIEADRQLLCDISLQGDEPAKWLDLNLPDKANLLRIKVDYAGGATMPASLGLIDFKLIR